MGLGKPVIYTCQNGDEHTPHFDTSHYQITFWDKENINEKGKYKGTPSLVVEILSKSSRGKDMITKLNLYMETGVKEFWLVDTDKKQIMLYSFKNCQLEQLTTFDEGFIKSVFFEGLSLNLSEIFV